MAVPAHHQMIEESYVHERQRPAQFEGDAAIRLAGLRDSGRMVVAADDGGGVMVQHPFEDLSRIHGGPVHGASKELLIADEPMPRIQKQATEDLVGKIREARFEESRCIIGGVQRPTGLRGSLEVAPAQLQGCLQPGYPSRAKTVAAAEFHRARRQQGPEAAPLTKELTTQAQRVMAPGSLAQEYGEQFAIG